MFISGWMLGMRGTTVRGLTQLYSVKPDLNRKKKMLNVAKHVPVTTKTCNEKRIQYSIKVSSPDLQHLKISKHLTLRECARNVAHDQSEGRSRNPRTLVVFFEWLGAKPKAVDRYCEKYHQRGLDVLCVKGTLVQFLRQRNGLSLAQEVLKYLRERNSSLASAGNGSERYLIHALSIGAFNHTLCMMVSHKEKDKCGWYFDSIYGSIFDSIVIGSIDNMVTGLSMSMSDNKVIQGSIRWLTLAYFYSRPKQTVQFFDACVEFFKKNPPLVPTHYFYSHDDPMCDLKAMTGLLEQWKRDFPEIKLSSTSWDTSIHAAHIRHHEVEYDEALNKFLAELKLD